MKPEKRIAILSTGDEIINGDITNTNAQAFASQLFSHGMVPGLQMTTTDDQDEIKSAIQFLLKNHDALIMSGGLGPTSDDRTRFALAEALGQPLIFDDDSWTHIQARFKQLRIDKQPDSNKQQCLFPEGATILINENGTANACKLPHHDQWIFMLPGPPNECLPIFMRDVMPTLENHQFASHQAHKNWLLIGVGEGEFAEKMEILAEDHDIQLGYRVQYPYLEFKCHADRSAMIDRFFEIAHHEITPFQINKENRKASDLLIEQLTKSKKTITVNDKATQGKFLSRILTPKTAHAIVKSKADYLFKISGLQEVWQEKDSTLTTLTINDEKISLKNRGEKTFILAIEKIAQHILNNIP